MLCSSARATAGVSCAVTATTATAAIAVHLCLVKLMTAQITRRDRCGHPVAEPACTGTPRLFDRVAWNLIVAALDQQPGLLFALTDSGQRIATVQLLAVQANRQVAAAKAGGHLMIGQVGVGALVPDDHAGSGILVVGVLQRPVFGATRHPSVLRIDRRPPGNSPRHQHTVDLETEVV